MTIGNFDGVHVGHQCLLKQLCLMAKSLGLPAVVVLFEPQPSEFFAQHPIKPRLSSLREKLYFIAHHQPKIDYVYCLRFNAHLAAMTAHEFITQIVLTRLNAKLLLLGEDFRFGKERHGDIPTLMQLMRNTACGLSIVPDYMVSDIRVSSTQIRQALLLAHFKSARLLLGRHYSLIGRVLEGAKLARRWGVSTANIYIARKNLPCYGVFCVQVMIVKSVQSDDVINNHGLYNGVANLGFRPTIAGDTRVILEVHLFDFKKNLYGAMLEVFFLHKLRDEVKFNNLATLIAQINQDLVNAHRYFDKTMHYDSVNDAI